MVVMTDVEYAYTLENFIRGMERTHPERAEMALREAPMWYPKARRFASYLSVTYEIPLDMCIGVISAMSIRQRWSRNQILAEEYIKCFMGMDCNIPRTFGMCLDKCEAIMLSDGEWDTILTILHGQKITRFAEVIKHGNFAKVVVIDSIMGLIMKFFTKGKKKGSIGRKAYRAMSNAVMLVADSWGWAYAELQAYAWVLYRGRAY
jgi:hypothetical protein